MKTVLEVPNPLEIIQEEANTVQVGQAVVDACVQRVKRN